MPMPHPSRRVFLHRAARGAAAVSLPATGLGLLASAPAQAADAPAAERRFAPQPGPWRTFDLTTRVDLQGASGPARVWLPVPSVDTDWQRSFDSSYAGSARTAKIVSDQRYGARMLVAEFDAGVTPVIELTSRVQTRSRATDWNGRSAQPEDAASLAVWLQPTDLLPTDGIVRDTAREATRGAKTDVEKVRAIYDWIVENTYREPTVRGCGLGDIKTMLETANFGGKCADLNGLFVGLCRAAGVPARDVYGIRLAPSAFGYKELGGNPAKLQGAQHCRAEVYLREHGWVAMDPADVAKVMRQETAEWIKDPSHPVVRPVRQALFGGWEGNWLGFNDAHDVSLPGAQGPRLGFLMYPQAETAAGRVDALDAERFRYTITAREIPA